MNNIKDLLPIGTVVILKGGKKRLMIFGIKQTVRKENELLSEYDYIGVPYPEGIVGTEAQFLFEHEDIETVYFRGYEDIERQEFIYEVSKAVENENMNKTKK